MGYLQSKITVTEPVNKMLSVIGNYLVHIIRKTYLFRYSRHGKLLADFDCILMKFR